MKTKTIEEAFINQGYVILPFSFNGVGHPIIKAIIANNVEVNFLMDTGASINLLDYELAKKLNLTLTPTGEKGSGAGGQSYEIFDLGETSLKISGQNFKFDNFYSMDLSSVQEALTSREVPEEIHGILGFGFFKMTKCFIDYADNRLFILNES